MSDDTTSNGTDVTEVIEDVDTDAGDVDTDGESDGFDTDGTN